MANLIELNVDINDMEEYEPLPAGPYHVEIREVQLKHSEATPHGYFVIKMRIDPEDYPADYDMENAPEGVIVTYANVKVPDPKNRRTVKPFKDFLRAIGVEGGNSFDVDEWVGKEVEAVLSIQEYQGAPTNGVDFLRAKPSV